MSIVVELLEKEVQELRSKLADHESWYDDMKKTMLILLDRLGGEIIVTDDELLDFDPNREVWFDTDFMARTRSIRIH